MLQIKNIKKEYKTGTLVQQALDDVSLNLRDNEFVAILGPSGSGKSTLLNIIGGLDRYDSGDLIINGVSTKKYKDRDWDSYRNHTIGFIFQSYNLIPHQTVLSNVELALTISGISGAERRQKAEEALIKVGLGDQMHKKPNQMSGGQMQRVAIARALVNNPSILLADEPTGALDTETSIQVMDLLKEVAKDRLVVMVTHNPDLAQEYANRIVKLKDGRILSDTNPYALKEEEKEPPVHKNLGKASMSFWTALSLSKNNLMTKKARTVLVSFAGSIGIIGIALIMSLSNGVNVYINTTERETLSEYPLTINSTSFDLTSMMTNAAADGKSQESQTDGVVKEKDVVSNMFSKVQSNDLASLKTYLETDPDQLSSYNESIEYSYDTEPLIYRIDGSSDRKVNPNTLLSSAGLTPTSSIYSSAIKTNVFSELPASASLYEDQYSIKAGRWPENAFEAVVVTNQSGSISDMALYTLGLKDYSELESMIKNQGSSSADGEDQTYPYEDFLGIGFKLVNPASLYVYDEANHVWTDKSLDSEYLKNVVASSQDIKIVGVVSPNEDTQVSMLTSGICYPSSLTQYAIEQAAQSDAVKAQMADPNINIFTGNTFDQDNAKSGFDYGSLFSVDSSKMASAFSIDPSLINTDINDYLDTAALSSAASNMSQETIQKFASLVQSNVTSEKLTPAMTDVLKAYLAYAAQDPTTDYAHLSTSFSSYLNSAEAKKIINEDLTAALTSGANASALTSSFTSLMSQVMQGLPQYMIDHQLTDVSSAAQEYLQSTEVQQKISAGLSQMISGIQISSADQQKLAEDLVNGYAVYAAATNAPDLNKLSDSFSAWMNSAAGQEAVKQAVSSAVDVDALTNALSSEINQETVSYTSVLSNAVQQAMSQMMAQLPNAFTVDTNAISSAFQMNMDTSELQSLFQSMMSQETQSYESNLTKLGYADINKPSEISIYPTSFEAKDSIKSILDSYNTQMNDAGQTDKVITYTDMVGTLMTSVTDIVNTISYVLIAFVAISLVVSSIMIGVITYISVLERKKEIGILRAIGASKHNISAVFNAETFITGLLAGVMGIVIACILLVPTNSIIHAVSGNAEVNAVMPINGALMLILLSVGLTMLGGLIPSKKAAKSDPVSALRTE
ncbi:MAG: ABC transporter ATP-binding protein/permease [Solobacterium sp.]|jgi:ABC-type lipoprotein export system ATPase subunit|nr:ABC transporter ATP-binding protein/permease [Solobacterium sp.]MCH4205126.1 ABC transporter ATP-binding protein/permease [Solobacterium sp.]MCH4226719.1 ABC transporter ATP-binding protein/permease [Solobacterium sp.]MCH4281952.1 ABC transporter ATP-binding protein/permease [Solobacterium sp.]